MLPVLKKLSLALIALLALLLIGLLIISLARLPIDVSSQKSLLETRVSHALGRPVAIEGKVILTTSLWPYFEIGGLSVASPPGFSGGDLLRMKRARVTVGLLPLLRRQVHIHSFAVEGLSLNLVRDLDGQVNWAGKNAGKATPSPDSADAPESSRQPIDLAVDTLSLGDISVRFEDRPEAQVQTFTLHEARGAAPFGEPMSLHMTGSLQEHPYTVSIQTTSLADLLAMTHTRAKLQIEIADTHFEFSGFTDRLGRNLSTELDIDVRGDRLDSLDRLLDVDLPPLKDYQLEAKVAARPGQLELSGLQLRVGGTSLSGNAMVDDTVSPPDISLDLASETIQLADFATGEWSPEPPDSPADPEPETRPDSERLSKPLSAESLRRLNASLAIKVGEVLSGTDRFGGGEFNATLRDGRISVDPLKLEAGEQALLLRVSIKPDPTLSDASLRILAKNVDMAALIRLARPDSNVGGVLNIDIDVHTAASRFRDLLANANGYFDIAARPENLRSGLVDLWAVNLLASVVDSAVKGDDAPQVNCLLSRWSLERGRMKARQLAVDTSRIRICGEGRIDFGDRRVKLSVWPKAKRPEFFSLATPLKVKGTFEDFGVGIKGGPLTLGTTAVGFVISPVTTPFKRLLREDLPADGGDICGLPIGPHEGKLDSVPGC